jgi:hypothetical protein
MTGKPPLVKGKLLARATSTPTQNQRGVTVPMPYVKLVTYEVNVRSFHPNTNFEPLGFRFEGDNRGFSLGESWFGDTNVNQSKPTSRIWQRYQLNAAGNTTGEFKPRTESNPSSGGPSLWGFFGGTEPYEDADYKPRGTLIVEQATEPHGGQKILKIKTWYGGENHAFRTSKFQEWVFGGTSVPTLDVSNELFIRIERVSLYMDIVSLTYGDGFPNAESFIKDPAGNKLMLGTHVRIGFPATHLWNKNQRLMWANAVRVELTPDGNFGEKLWVFARVLGGPPNLRDDYPTGKYKEVCSATTPNPTVDLNVQSTGMGTPIVTETFRWNCSRLESISNKGDTLPMHLSAFVDIRKVRAELEKTWLTPPMQKTTRTAWNDAHLHRNPNGGLAKDDYDVAIEKWQAQKK